MVCLMASGLEWLEPLDLMMEDLLPLDLKLADLHLAHSQPAHFLLADLAMGGLMALDLVFGGSHTGASSSEADPSLIAGGVDREGELVATAFPPLSEIVLVVA